jgi:hypothetical protein
MRISRITRIVESITYVPSIRASNPTPPASTILSQFSEGFSPNQLGDGLSAWSITKLSTGPFELSNFSPSSGIKFRKGPDGSL